MIKSKFILILLMLISLIYNAQQIIDKYPHGIESYKGGNKQFYKDFHDILVEKNIKPCENKNEYYAIDVAIYPDSTIKFVKDDDTLSIQKNKCAYEVTREVFKYLKGWNPLVVDEKQYTAISRHMIFPDYLFEKYKEDYDIKDYYKLPEFIDGGINGFRQKLTKVFNSSAIKSGYFQVVVTFEIDENGNMEKPYLTKESENKSFNKEALNSVGRIKGKWKPATLHGIPIRSKFNLPLTMSFE
ncbi:energy transducer TonB [Chryseobacterium sp. SIMBA_038]|uniref:energy transducer TonB n=1 Tax=Chryseobacterium sp. SIMBA_038 TaxID=3085780 RepID=UPI00397C4848